MGTLSKKDDLGSACEWCKEHTAYPTAETRFKFIQLLLVCSAAWEGLLNSSAHLTAQKPFESHSFADQKLSVPDPLCWSQPAPNSRRSSALRMAAASPCYYTCLCGHSASLFSHSHASCLPFCATFWLVALDLGIFSNHLFLGICSVELSWLTGTWITQEQAQPHDSSREGFLVPDFLFPSLV